MTFYSTHAQPLPFTNFIEKEVFERQNYSMLEVQEWMDEYNFDMEDKYVWVATNKKMAYRYLLPASEWGNLDNIDIDDSKLYTYIGGTIISESFDDEDGYIMIIKDDKE